MVAGAKPWPTGQIQSLPIPVLHNAYCTDYSDHGSRSQKVAPGNPFHCLSSQQAESRFPGGSGWPERLSKKISWQRKYLQRKTVCATQDRDEFCGTAVQWLGECLTM